MKSSLHGASKGRPNPLYPPLPLQQLYSLLKTQKNHHSTPVLKQIDNSIIILHSKLTNNTSTKYVVIQLKRGLSEVTNTGRLQGEVSALDSAFEGRWNSDEDCSP